MKTFTQFFNRRAWLLLVVALICPGCNLAPLKGGRAVTVSGAGRVEQTVEQPENPAAISRQDHETVRVKTYTIPAGSRPEETRTLANGQGERVTNVVATVLSAAMPVTEREEVRAKSELGAAQKDTAREIGAKLASLKGLVGVGIFLFGIASMFYPPLKAIVNSTTTCAAIIAGGLALMILPSLVAGNEFLILGGVAVLVGGWFLAHRYGKMRGTVEAKQND